MTFYISYLLLLVIVYKLYPFLSRSLEMYQTYRSIVDPQKKRSICSPLFSYIKTFFNIKTSYSIDKFNRDYIKIKYTYKDNPYFYLLKVKRGVTPLLKLTDEDGNNILDAITPYLGPNLDCHGVSLTPHDFGYKKIIATTVFDTSSSFDEHEQIVF